MLELPALSFRLLVIGDLKMKFKYPDCDVRDEGKQCLALQCITCKRFLEGKRSVLDLGLSMFMQVSCKELLEKNLCPDGWR
jgi:hypothetical protein